MTTEETKEVKSVRGGRRPGAGRKPGSGLGLTAKLQICVTPTQAQTFKTIGGSRWLRRQLDREKELKAEQRGRSVLRLPLEAQFVKEPEDMCIVQMQTARRGRAASKEGVTYKSVDLMDMLVPTPSTALILAAPDNGMKDAGIVKGDMLVVDRSTEPCDGHVVLARVGEEYLVRRLSIAVLDVTLVPEHAGGKEETRVLDENEEWQVIGVVSNVIKRLSAA